MKQPERVAKLLNELRTLAENDFERHRLDVLERDLTKPSQVKKVICRVSPVIFGFLR